MFYINVKPRANASTVANWGITRMNAGHKERLRETRQGAPGTWNGSDRSPKPLGQPVKKKRVAITTQFDIYANSYNFNVIVTIITKLDS